MIPHDFKRSWIVSSSRPLLTGVRCALKAVSAVLFVLAVYFLTCFCFSY